MYFTLLWILCLEMPEMKCLTYVVENKVLLVERGIVTTSESNEGRYYGNFTVFYFL